MWKKHALQRIMERNILRSEVKEAIEKGKIIEGYPDDYPYPSCLLAYIDTKRPLHVVVSLDIEAEILYVITAYTPDETHFNIDLITRK